MLCKIFDNFFAKTAQKAKKSAARVFRAADALLHRDAAVSPLAGAPRLGAVAEVRLRAMCLLAAAAVVAALVRSALAVGVLRERLALSLLLFALLADLLEDLLLLLLMTAAALRALLADSVLDAALNAAQQVVLARVDEGDGLAALARAARAPDAVNVALRIVRDVVVEDVCDALDVEAARCDVRRAEDLELCLAEALEDERALDLREVAVQLIDEVTARRERHRDHVCALLRVAEDHREVRLLLIDDLAELVDLRLLARVDDDLVDGIERHVLRLDLEILRRRHVACRKCLDAVRHRRGKQHELAVRGRRLEQRLDIFDETEAHHLIGLVEDDLVDLREVDRLAAQVVEQAARRADDELRVAAELLLLALDVLPAEDDERGDVGCGRERLRDLGDLDGQLARRRDDERLRDSGLRLDFLDDRQQEGERLARARLRLDDAVVTGAHERHRLLLHRRRLLDAVTAQHVAERGADAEFLECCHISILLSFLFFLPIRTRGLPSPSP